MDLYQFMGANRWLTAWLALLLLLTVYSFLQIVLLAYDRTIRMINIRKHGWPPPHCDADGDQVADEDSDD